MPNLVSETQCGFVPGRFIGDNTILIYDVMHYLNKNNTVGLLMLIDFEKAFDSISWVFINKVLKYFNFGNNFIKWITILNTNIKGAVIQCGKLSKFLDIKRGCRQGDPISPYLFILCAEILKLLIQNNKKVKGIDINGYEVKISQFADDTAIFLDSSQLSLQTALKVLETFGTISGLVMNTSKTKVIWLGRNRFLKDKLKVNVKLDRENQEFSVLGITFDGDLKHTIELNYEKVLIDIHKLLACWKK